MQSTPTKVGTPMETVIQYQATQKGGPFALVSVPKPVPDHNEVSIRMKALGLNPIDWKRFHYGVRVESWPAVFGSDGSGIVEAVGDGVTKFKRGDEVFGVFGGGLKGGAFQEIATVPETFIAKKPGNVSFEEAASLPVGYVTAAAAIYDALAILLPFLADSRATGAQPNSILVLGGSSVVGASAIQLLRLARPSAIILATSSSQHHSHLTFLGATEAFDQNSSTLITDIISASPEGKGVDMIIDAVASGAVQTRIFETLSTDGPKEYAEVLTGVAVEPPEGVKKHKVVGLSVFQTPGGVNIMPALTELVSHGKYKIPCRVKRAGYGFDEIPKALEELQAGVSGTKLVVTL